MDNKEPRGDSSPEQTTWSLSKIFTSLERSAHSPWERLIKNLLSHLSPLVKVWLRWVFFVLLEWGNTGIALLTRLLGAWQRFYHHWKGLIELHEEKWSKFSFLIALLLLDWRIEEYYWGNDVTRGSNCWQHYVVVDRGFTTMEKGCSISMRKMFKSLRKLSSTNGSFRSQISAKIESLEIPNEKKTIRWSLEHLRLLARLFEVPIFRPKNTSKTSYGPVQSNWKA